MEREKILLVLIGVLAAVAAINQYNIVTAAVTSKASPENLIPYTEAGYQQLLGYDKTIKLSSAQMQNYVGLDVQMPCCGFKTLQAAGNCGCGHHIALSGLAKYMASKDYSKAQIQSEIDTWKNVFYGNNSGVASGSMGAC